MTWRRKKTSARISKIRTIKSDWNLHTNINLRQSNWSDFNDWFYPCRTVPIHGFFQISSRHALKVLIRQGKRKFVQCFMRELNRRTYLATANYSTWYLPIHLNSSICGRVTVFRFDNLRKYIVRVRRWHVRKFSGWKGSKKVGNLIWNFKCHQTFLRIELIFVPLNQNLHS